MQIFLLGLFSVFVDPIARTTMAARAFLISLPSTVQPHVDHGRCQQRNQLTVSHDVLTSVEYVGSGHFGRSEKLLERVCQRARSKLSSCFLAGQTQFLASNMCDGLDVPTALQRREEEEEEEEQAHQWTPSPRQSRINMRMSFEHRRLVVCDSVRARTSRTVHDRTTFASFRHADARVVIRVADDGRYGPRWSCRREGIGLCP